MHSLLVPKIVDTFREGYKLKNLQADLISGVVVGILSIPMSIAFAIASGARPEVGLITAIVAGALGALTTGSRHQVTGPTGAFVVLISSIIYQYGYDGLTLATLMAGVILLVMGVSRLGFVIKFIPYPVTIGFTSGIALLIATGQLPDFFGVSIPEFSSKEIFGKWISVFYSLPSIQWPSFSVGLSSLFIVILWPKLKTKIPGSLIAIIFSVLLVKFLQLDVTTIGDRFGHMHLALGDMVMPKPDLNELPKLISPAIAIALLAGIESLLSAVVADGMTGRRHRSNMELLSQGVVNIASSLVGGLPATGAIARTATNIKSGGSSPLAAFFCAMTILVLLLFFQNLMTQIPLASLAAILLVISYNMSEWRHFRKLFRSPTGDVVTLLTTFFLTVFVDLVTGIEVGIILAAFIFINKMVDSTKFFDYRDMVEEEEDREEFNRLIALNIPPEVQVFEIRGPLFFAAAEKFKMALKRFDQKPSILILRMRHLSELDATGTRALSDILDQSELEGTKVIFSGINGSKPIYQTLKNSGLVDRLGAQNIQPNINASVALAKTVLQVK